MDVYRGKKWGRLSPSTEPKQPAEATEVDSQGETQERHVSTETDQEEEQQQTQDPVEHMRNILGQLPEPDPEVREALTSRLPPEKMKEILNRVWQKRQKQLEEAIKKMKTEAQQMHSILQDLGENNIRYAEGQQNASDYIVTNLEDLEYYVGKLDNARDFAKMGGLEACLMLLNHTELPVREAAAWVVGSTVKMERELQDLAVSIGSIPMFLNAVKDLANWNTEASFLPLAHIQVLNKCIYTLGGILRRNPNAQAQLMYLDGGNTLVQIGSNSIQPLFSLNATSTMDYKEWDKTLVLVSKISVIFGDIMNDVPYTPRPHTESASDDNSETNKDEGAPDITIRKEDGSFTDIDTPVDDHKDVKTVAPDMKNFLQGEAAGEFLMNYVRLLAKFIQQARRDHIEELDLTEDHLDKALQTLISAHKGGIFYQSENIDNDLLADTLAFLQQLRDIYSELAESGSEDVAMLAEMRQFRVETVISLMHEYS